MNQRQLRMIQLRKLIRETQDRIRHPDNAPIADQLIERLDELKSELWDLEDAWIS